MAEEENETPEEPKKKSKLILFIILGVVLLLVGGGGFFAFTTMMAPKMTRKAPITPTIVIISPSIQSKFIEPRIDMVIKVIIGFKVMITLILFASMYLNDSARQP